MDVFDLLLQNLKTLFDVREVVNGKVDMQKSLYFMKEFGYAIPFRFRWSKLGPYSHELANILEHLTVQGYLNYTGQYDVNEKYFRFVEPHITSEIKNFFYNLENICNKNNYNEIDFIECAASLHFIYKYTSTKTKEKTFKKLAMLKPERMPKFTPLVNSAWGFLKDNGLIV